MKTINQPARAPIPALVPLQSIPAAPPPPRRAARRASPAWLALLFPLLLLVGCAVSFVSPYDALTAEAIQQAAVQAETLFAKVTTGNTAYAAMREDYRELEGQLAVVAARAALPGAKNEAEQALVAKLQGSIARLEKWHRDDGPYDATQTEGARSLLRQLLHHGKGKKAAAAATGEGGA